MTKSIKIVLVLLVTLLLAACASSGATTHGPDRICDDPTLIHECRYGGDSDTSSHDGDGDDGEGDDE